MDISNAVTGGLMKIISWNVNGLGAVIEKGFADYIIAAKPDIVMLQEIKVSTLPSDFIDFCKVEGFHVSHNPADRKGYSGTLCLYRKKPSEITFGMKNKAFDSEGRLITLDYPDYYIINAYIPNSQANLERSYFRFDWDTEFRAYVEELQHDKPVIIGGDFNVARAYIDVFPENLRVKENPPGFLDEERDSFERLLDDCNLVDVFRHFYPETEGAYTWWSNRRKKRDENRGWRIDYFLVSVGIIKKVKGIVLNGDIMGSDHCPIEIKINL